MAAIKGITVTLYERISSGKDAFGAPLYEETPVFVDNVLVCPVSQDDVTDSAGLDSRRAEYYLCIPKGDTHAWEGCKVEFFGKIWRVFGPPLSYIDANTPGNWNTRVRVERYE